MNKNLTLTYDEVIENAKFFNYEYEEFETSDNGYAIAVHVSSFYKITYYFDTDKMYDAFDVEDLTNLF